MLEWVLARDRRAHVLLTKADKLNRRDADRVLAGDQRGLLRYSGHVATVFGAREAGIRGGARRHGPTGWRGPRKKKAPVGA